MDDYRAIERLMLRATLVLCAFVFVVVAFTIFLIQCWS